MFGTILISAVTIMQIYVFWRIIATPLVVRLIPKKFILGIGFLFWIVFVAGRFVGHGGSGAFFMVLELAGMNWLGTVFLLFVSFIVVDVATGFGLLLPKLSPYFRVGALVAGFFLSIFALFQGIRPPVIQNYEVFLSGLPAKMDGTTLVAVSDTHLGSLQNKQWLRSIVLQIKALNPDIIVLLGDIHEGHGSPQSDFVPILEKLSAPLGVWSVLGNHENHRRSENNASLAAESGFNMLRNKWSEIRPGLILAGVDDNSNGHGQTQDKEGAIAKALSGKPIGATILLSHSPFQVDEAAKAGTQLMLCGHTHDGQIWPFNYLVKRRYPMVGGRYEVNGMTVIVCRGTGTWGPRMRLWYPSEIIRITLRSNEGILKGGI